MLAEQTLSRLLGLAAVDAAEISPNARTIARFSLFDWLVVARAGSDEPLSRIVRDFVRDEGGKPVATIVGGLKVPARAAALVNGTISHALDYDDTHFAHIGHLSVAIMPAALAMAEETGATAAAACDAFLIGAEAACRIGMVLGRQHYERGFHQTATAGAFGATVAAGRLLGLSREQMRNALSLVSTRASGLKSQFGTMGKPFNAGIAASNGVEAAALAARGFVSCDDGVGGLQGFIDTHAEQVAEDQAWANPPPGTFAFEDNKYKLHACCHGTHAMINALVETMRGGALSGDQVERMALRTNRRWMQVCDIKQPRTGLEVKFSYGYLAAMALTGINTAAEDAYTADLCRDPTLGSLARRLEVTSDAAVSDTAAVLTIDTKDGRRLSVQHDLAARIPADRLEAGLRGKARGLLGEATAGRLWAAVVGRDRLSARDLAGLLGT